MIRVIDQLYTVQLYASLIATLLERPYKTHQSFELIEVSVFPFDKHAAKCSYHILRLSVTASRMVATWKALSLMWSFYILKLTEKAAEEATEKETRELLEKHLLASLIA